MTALRLLLVVLAAFVVGWHARSLWVTWTWRRAHPPKPVPPIPSPWCPASADHVCRRADCVGAVCGALAEDCAALAARACRASECVPCNRYWAPWIYGPAIGEPCPACGRSTTAFTGDRPR